MYIKNIMSQSVVTVEMDDSLKVVKDIFDNTRFHHLLVIEHGKLFGIISDRDLLKTINPNIGTIAETNRDLAVLNQKAHQIMTRKPIALNENSKVYDAVQLFNTHNISCLPVVNNDNKPIGIVSWRDILKTQFSDNKTTY